MRYMNSRAEHGCAYIPTKGEHIANMLTHAMMIVPGGAALLWLVHLSVTYNQLLAGIVYGAAIVALFSTSTLFHVISYSGKLGFIKNVFHIGDRAVIYLYIAASYTPWLVLRDAGSWNTEALCVVWTMAVAGIIYQYTFHEQFKSLETLFYVIIGVCPCIVILVMTDYSGLIELALGGTAYMVGITFFKSDGKVPFAHAIWHCFVSIGATFQIFAVAKYLYNCPVLDKVPDITSLFKI